MRKVALAGISAGRSRRLCSALALLCLLAPLRTAFAQMPQAGNRALPRLAHLGLPVSPEAPLVVSAHAGLGALDVAQNTAAGGRLLGGLALAYSWDLHWTLALDWAGHNDGFGEENNGYGEPRLTARYVGAPAGKHSWGAELDARFIGSAAPSLEPGATSPSLRALYGYTVNQDLWLVANLGFHLNRSASAVPFVERLSGNDKRSLAASSWNGVPWGLGTSYSLGASTQLVGEVSGEWLVGEDAPPLGESPLRLSAGVKQGFSESWQGFLGIDLGLSARGAVPRDDILRQEPRLTALLGVSWRLRRPAPSPAPKRPNPTPPVLGSATSVAEPTPAAPAVVLNVSPVTGNIVDEGGRPLSDVSVVLIQGEAAPRTERSFADGHFEFRDVPSGAVRLEVAAEGFEVARIELGEAVPRTREIVLRPAVPAGQIRGKVLDLQGNPVGAQVTVASDGGAASKATGTSPERTPQVVSVAADGSFELDLAPGRYVMRFEHPDFAAQRRSVVIKDKGVVILNIALIR